MREPFCPGFWLPMLSIACGPLEDPWAAPHTGPSGTACGAPVVSISEIQGAGSVSPRLGEPVTAEGVVTAVSTTMRPGRGFFLQAQAPDHDPSTSDALFVELDSTTPLPETGERWRVQGRVAELAGLTAMMGVEVLQRCGRGSIAPLALELPVAADAERWEGTRVSSRQTWTLIDTFGLLGEARLRVSSRGRWFAPGHPLGQSATEATRTSLALLGMAEHTRDWIAAGHVSERLRLGARAPGLEGILLPGARPALLATTLPDLHAGAPAEPPPARPGALRVASLNLDNYFVTTGGRGAASAAQLERHRTQLVAACLALDADILALTELEGPSTASLRDLLAALHGQLPNERRYAYSETTAGGTDLRAAIAYRPSRVRALAPAWFASAPQFRRAPILQSFAVDGWDLTVVAVHLKSKLCNGAPELPSEEGCGAAVRREEARELRELTRDLVLESGTELLLVGDFNSDSEEAPLTELKRAGLVDLFAGLEPEDRYTYVFEGRSSQLDHALATRALAGALERAHIWHVNADEPEVLGYAFEPPLASPEADARRSSDHDPILVDFLLRTYP